MSRALSHSLVQRCEEASSLLASLAHPVRLKVLCHTMDGEKSVSELTKFCGISQSAMSQFLGRMRVDGLIHSRRVGTKIFYSIKDERVLKVLKVIKEICN